MRNKRRSQAYVHVHSDKWCPLNVQVTWMQRSGPDMSNTFILSMMLISQASANDRMNQECSDACTYSTHYTQPLASLASVEWNWCQAPWLLELFQNAADVTRTLPMYGRRPQQRRGWQCCLHCSCCGCRDNGNLRNCDCGDLLRPKSSA